MRYKRYVVEWHREAAKQWRDIRDPSLREEILKIIEETLAVDPMAGKPLSGPFVGVRSYRLGVIRIVYKPYKGRLVIVILRVEHRKSVYRLH